MKRFMTMALASAAMLGLTSTTVQAGTYNPKNTTSFSINQRNYVAKGRVYKLRLPVAGRLITNGDVTLKNSMEWTCIPYGKNKNTYYLRKGTYYLTSSKNANVKTTFTRLTKVRKSLETYVETQKNNDNSGQNARKIEVGQKIKAMGEMYNYDNIDYYRFTIDSPQMVTMKMTNNPIYQSGKGNIFSKMDVVMFNDNNPVGDGTILYPEQFKVNGNKTASQSWYLAKGTYYFSVSTRGLYNFQLTAVTDTRTVPADTEIESLKDTKDGVVATLRDALHAKTYELAWREKGSKRAAFSSSSNTTEVSTAPTTRNLEVNGHEIPVRMGNKLVNGQTYEFAARGVSNPKYIRYGNPETNNYFGAWTKIVEHTYYAPSDATPGAVNLTTAQADNTYHNIHVAWNKIDSAQSYRAAYRQKGTSKWYYEVTDQASNAVTGITRNRTYEVKLQALNGKQEGPWSAVKEVFLK